MNHVNRGPKTFCLFLRYSGEPTERSAVLVRQVKLKESIIIPVPFLSEAKNRIYASVYLFWRARSVGCRGPFERNKARCHCWRTG